MLSDAQHRSTTRGAQAEDDASAMIESARADADRTIAQGNKETKRSCSAWPAATLRSYSLLP